MCTKDGGRKESAQKSSHFQKGKKDKKGPLALTYHILLEKLGCRGVVDLLCFPFSACFPQVLAHSH